MVVPGEAINNFEAATSRILHGLCCQYTLIRRVAIPSPMPSPPCIHGLEIAERFQIWRDVTGTTQAAYRIGKVLPSHGCT